MTNPSIDFTDGIGAATLTARGLTFKNWTPDVHDIGDSEVPVGDSKTFFFLLRQDFIVAFDVDQIPLANVDIAKRLKSWLITGGSCTINTEDTDSHVYTATLNPGTVPEITLTDVTEKEYTLHLELINASASPFTYTPVITPRGGTLTLSPSSLFFQLGDPVTTQDVTATWLDDHGAPVVGGTIDGVSNNTSSFTITASGTTDGSGQVVLTVTYHLVGDGAVHAVAGSLIASIPVVVGVWEWDENFDQIDYATWKAQYSANWQWFAPTDVEDYLTQAVGVLHLNGDGTSTPSTNSLNFGPPVISAPFVPVGEWWAKIEVTMVGGAYDGYGGMDEGPLPLYFAFYGDGGETDLDVLASHGPDDVLGGPSGDPSVPGQFGVTFDAAYVNGTVSPLLTEGAHTFIVCLSNNGTVSKAELWIDQAARGDPPDVVNTGSYLVGNGVGDGMDHLYLQLAPPHSSGRSLDLHHVHWIGVPRAYDPFNIL